MAHTREEMLEIVRRGESVLHGVGVHARIISREEDVPSEAELATGDTTKLQAAREGLFHQRESIDGAIAAIDAELAGLAPPAKAARGKGKDASTGTEPPAGKESDPPSDPLKFPPPGEGATPPVPPS